MITLDLTTDDAALLREQLQARARQVEHELAHTDRRQLQREIAQDLERIERLRERVERALALEASPNAV
jgi:F0F1-type ATP synthase membrane subunit b/b'